MLSQHAAAAMLGLPTLQDRLLKALRLAGINDIIEAANAALPRYLAQHNARYRD